MTTAVTLIDWLLLAGAYALMLWQWVLGRRLFGRSGLSRRPRTPWLPRWVDRLHYMGAVPYVVIFAMVVLRDPPLEQAIYWLALGMPIDAAVLGLTTVVVIGWSYWRGGRTGVVTHDA